MLDESLTSHTIDVGTESQSYYLYSPSTPKGAILVLPSFSADHTEVLDGTKWGEPEQSMENSPFIQAAREYQFAVVFAEGETHDWYSPDNGEKKVLACLNDANITLNIPNGSWFVYGFSMGGTGALTMSIRYPELFSGLYIGDGVMNYTDPGFIEVYITGLSNWNTTEFLNDANPFRQLESFRSKAIALASGTSGINVRNCDNFSQTLDSVNIQHYYHRGDGGHDVFLLFNSINQTFNLFSHQLAGTVDQFYEGYVSPLKTASTSSWGVDLIVTVVLLIFISSKQIKRRK